MGYSCYSYDSESVESVLTRYTANDCESRFIPNYFARVFFTQIESGMAQGPDVQSVGYTRDIT